MLAQREVFFERLKDVPLSDVVVLDESYVTTQFTRLRGRSARGVRLLGRVPHGHWKLLTILAAIGVNGVVAAASIDATTDADVFGAFIDEVLVPALRPGQVVVMDNAAPSVIQSLPRSGCEGSGLRGDGLCAAGRAFPFEARSLDYPLREYPHARPLDDRRGRFATHSG